MTESEKPAPRGVRCEVHGLLYDPDSAGGCVLCRRDAGIPSQTAQPARSAAATDPALGKALAVTAGLVLLTSLGLYSAHRSVVKMLRGALPGASFDAGLSPEDLGSAGVDPRMQEVLDAIEELEEIDAKRMGVYDEVEGEMEGDEGYGDEDVD